MKRYPFFLCLFVFCSLIIVDQPLAEHHKPENSQKDKERKIPSHQVKDTKTKHKEGAPRKNRLKHHDPNQLYQMELEREFHQRQMDFQLQLAQREQEWDQERERRETEHHLRMETMRIQHDREIEMRERESRGMGHQLFHLDVGLDLDMERLHEILNIENREKVELLQLRLEQEQIKIMAEIRIQEIEIHIALRKAFFGSEKVDQQEIADQVSAIAKSHGDLKFLELKTMLQIKDLLSEKQIQQLRHKEEDHNDE